MKEGAKAGGLRILSDENIRRINEAGLSLLDKPGIFCESRSVQELFKKGSAIVDSTKGMIRIDRRLVEAALKAAPKSFVLHGSDPQMDLLVKTGRVHYGMGGTSEPFFYDYGLGHSRKPTRKDMEAATRVGQQLANIDFVMTLCTSGDVPVAQAFYHDLATILRNTSKPAVFTMLDRPYARRIIEMACAAAGGEEELRKRPNIMALVCPVSPLVFPGIAEGIIDAVESGLPVLYSPGPMLTGTGPATLAGLLAQTIAEILFGLVLIQLIRPGAPMMFKMDSDVMDPATGQCTYSSPEQVLGRSALAQFGYFYDIPTFTMGGGVESKLPDSEAAAQAMMGTLMNSLAGITMNQSHGTMASGMYGSVEQLVICDEMIHMIKRVLRGFEVNDDTLALEVIRSVGPGGSFMMEDHSLNHFRKESFFPELFRRQSIDDWLTRGAKSAAVVAHERVEEILAQEKSRILSPQREKALEQALARAVSGLE
jgi:trimethylamine--corrinoid protein Co-methyltransferase